VFRYDAKKLRFILYKTCRFLEFDLDGWTCYSYYYYLPEKYQSLFVFINFLFFFFELPIVNERDKFVIIYTIIKMNFFKDQHHYIDNTLDKIMKTNILYTIESLEKILDPLISIHDIDIDCNTEVNRIIKYLINDFGYIEEYKTFKKMDISVIYNYVNNLISQ